MNGHEVGGFETFKEAVSEVIERHSADTLPPSPDTSPSFALSSSSPKFKRKQVESGIRNLLEGLGVDLNDENFRDTPARVARAFQEMCSGLYVTEQEIADVYGRRFSSPYKGMVVVGPVKAIGMCPHHLLPIHYEAVLAYIPTEQKLGLSKLARAIKLFCSAPKMQETVSDDIISSFFSYIQPQGAALFLKGSHNCMTSRGISQPDSFAITQDVRGLFETDPGVKAEFMQQLSILVGR
jgi:GTP cyclohydrolase IA